MSYEDEIYHLVQEIDAKVQGAREAIGVAERDRVVRPLPGRLGSVTVTGVGELVDV